MKWGRQPDKLQPSYASERTWIACRKWSWRAAYFGGDTRTRVQLGRVEGYCPLVGAMAQLCNGHPTQRGSQRSPAGLHRKTRDRGRVSQLWRASAACHPDALPRELLLESCRGSP